MVTKRDMPEGGPGDEKDYVDGAPDRPDNPILALIHDLRYGQRGVKSRAMWLVGSVGALVVVLCIGGLLIAFTRGGSASPNNLGGAFPTAPAGDSGEATPPPAPAPTGTTPEGWSPFRPANADLGFVLEINHEVLGAVTLVGGDGSTAEIKATFDGSNVFVNLADGNFQEGEPIAWAGQTMTVAGSNPPGLRFISVPSTIGTNTSPLKIRLSPGEVAWLFSSEQGQVFAYKLRNVDGTNMELTALTPQLTPEGALASFEERGVFPFAVNVEGVGGLTQNKVVAEARWAGYQVVGPDGQPTGDIDWILP